MLPIQLIRDDKWSCCMSTCYRCSWSLSASICWWCHEQWKSFEVHSILVLSSAILVHLPRNSSSLFLSFSFCFNGLQGTNLPSRNRHKRETISHSRWLPPPPPPLVVRSLIPQPKKMGEGQWKCCEMGLTVFFISLRGIEWLSNHSWTSIEILSHQWVTFTTNGRL